MSPTTNDFDWRVGYGFFCLIYVAWVVYLGLDNFDKVHGEYRDAARRLKPGQIENIALQELTDQCRTKLKRRGKTTKAGKTSPKVLQDSCASFPEAILTEKRKAVKQHLQKDKKRFQRKLIVFYITFAAFFLVLPMYLLYLLLASLFWVFKDIKIHK